MACVNHKCPHLSSTSSSHSSPESQGSGFVLLWRSTAFKELASCWILSKCPGAAEGIVGEEMGRGKRDGWGGCSGKGISPGLLGKNGCLSTGSDNTTEESVSSLGKIWVD